METANVVPFVVGNQDSEALRDGRKDRTPRKARVIRDKKPAGPRPVIIVVWDDAFYDDNPHTEAELKEASSASCRLYSVGFLVNETEAQVVISMDFGEDTSCRHVCRIRRENIREIRALSK